MKWLAALPVLALLLVGCSVPPEHACLRDALEDIRLGPATVLYRDREDALNRVSTGTPVNRLDYALLPQRAASLTKPLVAHAVADASLDLDAPAFDPATRSTNPAVASISLRHLLTHTSGFDPAISGDPLFFFDPQPGQPSEPDCRRAARYIARSTPNHAPGNVASYSNAGYCHLGVWLSGHPLPRGLASALAHPLGGAGGWHSRLSTLYRALETTLPTTHVGRGPSLPDGSHYDLGWRHTPTEGPEQPVWTHYGELPGMFAVGLANDSGTLVLAYFKERPSRPGAVVAALKETVWTCLEKDARGGQVTRR